VQAPAYRINFFFWNPPAFSIFRECKAKSKIICHSPSSYFSLASLIDFQRVSVGQGDQANVAFRIPREKFSFFNEEVHEVLHKGKAIITLANASAGERSGMLGAESYEIEVEVR